MIVCTVIVVVIGMFSIVVVIVIVITTYVCIIIIERFAEYGWKPHRVLSAQKAYHRPHVIHICVSKQRGAVSSNSRSQRVLFQQYSANLSSIRAASAREAHMTSAVLMSIELRVGNNCRPASPLACITTRCDISAWADAWMHGCMDAWMQVCADAWMRGCVDAWMHGCMDAWMHGCMDA